MADIACVRTRKPHWSASPAAVSPSIARAIAAVGSAGAAAIRPLTSAIPVAVSTCTARRQVMRSRSVSVFSIGINSSNTGGGASL